MDRYGGAQATEGLPADREAEWSSHGGEPEHEEPTWHFSLVGGAESYPERPGEADCIHYLRTGFCGYGSRCRFNHPRDRGLAVGDMRTTALEFPERVGQPVCQYYMRTGMCRYGVSCKYHHPRQGVGSSPVALNVSGYPIRPGEKECSYYMKTGQCKFGIICKFHHPQPAGVQVPTLAAPLPLPAPPALPAQAIYPSVQSPSVQSSEQYGVMAGNWSAARSAVLPGSYFPGTYGHMLLQPGMVPIPSWQYLASLRSVASPSNQATSGAGAIYGLAQLSPAAPAYSGTYSSPVGPSVGSQKEHSFPERPGQPECLYYMKTGDCKYGSSCKYHHPPDSNTPKTNFTLSAMDLPLRPGARLCLHYAQNGVCKFGPSCRFDHPMGTLSYSPSASSVADMPVAPYPVGSSMGTLAPSSSSSDSRPELISASNKDISSRMSFSMISSKSSFGSLLSKSGDVPISSAHQSEQVPIASGSRSTGHGGEVAHQTEQKS